MLVRIVLWWSCLTTLTGFAVRLGWLVVIRFLFGAGEAGTYPTAATVIFRWFPAAERGRSFGAVLLSGQLGAALAPVLIVPLQIRFGWRASFYLFGTVGIGWSVAWWCWYRNTPREMAGLTAQELTEIGPPPAANAHAMPWRAIGANRSVGALMGATFGYLCAYHFFLFWLPTYLVRERGFTESQTQLSALPFVIGMIPTWPPVRRCGAGSTRHRCWSRRNPQPWAPQRRTDNRQ